MIDDAELLRRYAEERSEAAFTEFVGRQIGLVYSAALRRTGSDAHRAADVAQQVFLSVARHAAALARHPRLTGWLYTATRNAAHNLMREEQRRAKREQAAQVANDVHAAAEAPADWGRVAPVLDAAMDELNERDREAVLLRYFEGRPLHDLGMRFGVSENAARMRVERALEKLRGRLVRRGLTSTATALGLALGAHGAVSAPAAVTASVSGAALAGVTGAAGGSVAASLTIMGMTKLQGGIAVVAALAVGALLVRTKFATFVVAGATIALLGIAIWQMRARDRFGIARPSVEARIQRLPAAMANATPIVTDTRQSLTAPPAPRPGAAAGGREPRRAGTEIMTRYPEVKQALVDWHVAKVNFQFAPLYTELGLTPGQIARFQELVRGTTLFGDWGARGEFLEFEAPRGVPEEQVRAELEQLLGADGFARYQAALRAIRPREWTAQLASQLCLTDSPLTPAQAAELVAIFRDAPYRPDDLSEAQTRASAVLSDTQLPALQRLFTEKRKWFDSDAAQRQSAERVAAREQSASADDRSIPPVSRAAQAQVSVDDLARVIALSRNDPAAVNVDLDAHRPMLAWRFSDFFRRQGIDGETRERLLENAYRGMADERDLWSAAAALGLRVDDPAVHALERRMDEDYLAAQRALLGGERVEALNAYEEQAFLRNIATALAGTAVLADAPMSAAQIRQLGDLIVRQVNGPIARRGAAKLQIDWRSLDAAARTLLSERQHALFISTEAPGGGGGGARFMLLVNQAIHCAVFAAP